MHIVIPDDAQNVVRTLDAFTTLSQHTTTIYTDTVKDVDVLAERFASADALVLIRERTAITRSLIEQLPKLRLISQTGRGTAHIDLQACADHGITITVGTGSPYAPAELTWALILASMRQIPQAVTDMQAGRWQTTFGTSVRGRTLGILGYGKIGALVARYGRAFEMNILVWGRDGSLTRAAHDGYEAAANQRDLFEQADVLSVHVKLAAETRGLITSSDLAAMKPSALFVNTSRAELLQPGVLVEALHAGRPGFAAVDVYESEPVFSHPLLHMGNVICTPHLGYVERDSYQLYFGEAFDNVNAFFEGKTVNNVTPQGK